jgi:hypothetical protein
LEYFAGYQADFAMLFVLKMVSGKAAGAECPGPDKKIFTKVHFFSAALEPKVNGAVIGISR